ncbi:unnamed protein product (macronuclear) [Paramecium tetraurelia]|uniref:Glutathione peroxidase n=1 Tax=Paramecium tetraurelia TaxID=5888 RepID=A0BCD6_PARTE|nr:uncharacterized protein GSPATT00004297001 [Paramecium tetraurelia]CAK56203.1 unnamed protein product [Paramecium tetraurelia]|eukprot:XP_001423601.1 hypothetical protein (macronuclear) [Paramecium tetraurelia strain d4-2]
MGCLFFKSAVDNLQPPKKSFFEFQLKDIDGVDTSLSKFKGKKVIICVNVACSCGLTSGNYSELVALYKKYSAQGLEILGFPCNQFMNQESKPEPEIKEFVIQKYGVSFPLFQKIEVNGPNTHELYQFLRLNSNNLRVSETSARQVPWNFGKFLLDSQGNVVAFFQPTQKPNEMIAQIEKLLSQ